MKKSPIILFFIRSSVPTEEEVKAAEALGVPVKFRNAEFATNGNAPEECDGVAGVDIREVEEVKDAKTGVVSYKEGKVIGSTIPEVYAETYPNAEKVVAAYKAGKPFPKKKVVTEDSGEAEDKAKPAGWTAGK